MKTIATIERRYERCGFAYTARTRMMYAPKFTVTRNDADKELGDIVLCSARNHPDPNERDVAECLAAVVAMYPLDRIHCDTAGGLVPIYDPDKPPSERSNLLNRFA